MRQSIDSQVTEKRRAAKKQASPYRLKMIKLGEEGRLLERSSADLSAKREVINSSRSVHSIAPVDKRQKITLEEEVKRHIESTDHLLV